MAIDRRVARTRTALFDALVALLRERHYDDIGLDDIIRRADVGRSTFYAHFRSKDDLLARSLERLAKLLQVARDHVRTHATGPEAEWTPIRALFEHVAEFAQVRERLAQSRGAAIVEEAIGAILAGMLRANLPRDALGVPRELAIRHLVATMNTTLRWWADREPHLTAARTEELFRQLAFQGLPATAAGLAGETG